MIQRKPLQEISKHIFNEYNIITADTQKDPLHRYNNYEDKFQKIKPNPPNVNVFCKPQKHPILHPIGDPNDQSAITEYELDILNEMKKVELNYIPSFKDLHLQLHYDQKIRISVIDWLISIHKKYHYHTSTLFHTVQILDSVLAKVDLVPEDYQLLAAASFFEAAKIEERRVPRIEELITLSGNDFSGEDILKVEDTILTTLNFKMDPVLVTSYLPLFLSLVKADRKELMLAYFFCETSLLNENFIGIRPSKIAAASVCLSITLERDYGQWNHEFEQYTSYSKEDLQDCAQLLLESCISIASSKYQTIRRKYAKAELGSVSLMNFPETIIL